MIERGFLPFFPLLHFSLTLSQEAYGRCSNGLIPPKKLSSYCLHALRFTAKPEASALLSFFTFQVLPLTALFQNHLPSEISPFAFSLSVALRRSSKVNHRVSLLQSWLSPITGADLLDVSDLSSPQPL